MAFIRFLLWTSFCIGFGVFLARYEVNGQTPLGHLERLWTDEPSVEGLKKRVRGAVDEAKGAIAQPSEQHAPEDRAQVNRLIAGRRAK